MAYVGSNEDVMRIRKHEKQREEQRKKFEDQKNKHAENVDKAGFRNFGTGQSEVLEAAFKNQTVGLVTREEFVSKRQTLADRFEQDAKRKRQESENRALRDKLKEKKKKAKLAAAAKLSFLGGDDEGAGEPQEADATTAAAGTGHNADDNEAEEAAAERIRFATLGKDPTAQADFLPDKDKERTEEELRDQLKREWQLRQQAIRNEALEITYSYWDGSGHRRKIVVKKGNTIAEFLHAVREQLSPEFRELRATSASNLMYVKEDLILPGNVSFYDLIILKARGKSGPLFHFDVHEDIRLQNDASIEKDESHAGKVVERHWYNRNKHIFPASRWEYYDPEKPQGGYTIRG